MNTTKQINEIIQKTDFSDPAKRLTRAQAIRWKCADCTNGQYREIKLCTIKTCPLWPYRLGSEARGREVEAEVEAPQAS